ncbi:hypothetical protein [Nocardia terpenica]|nr:hypothetical protein [Nocardia terpenica]MBF6062315.1 hypothetical protein [Nocardia terpenica]MBF6104403.1 hypothetical protein [Nocardia terpenica]MBF6109741.1 hypothetical protein [Nocardia terpenica]MBF6120047.1 hypothetical protein [Nocardia terpenica]MBF6152458.1 hypothetical protein [Nocardia terpenica]
MTTTVYYHNRCDAVETLYIRRHTESLCDDSPIQLSVDANAKGSEVVRCGDVTSVDDHW